MSAADEVKTTGTAHKKGVEAERMPGPGEFPAETQKRKEGVGLQREMQSQPITEQIAEERELVDNLPTLTDYRASGRLAGRRALITGGDSGIGRAIALFYAKEGAHVSISYLPVEQKDAEDTLRLIEKHVGIRTKKDAEGCCCKLIPLDIQSEENCKKIIKKSVKAMGGLDILVNNAAYQMLCPSIEELSADQIEKTFRTNVFAPLYLVKHALPHMSKGSSILFSTSVVAYKGSPELVDYTATKAAMIGIIRSLARQLAPRGIRVNGVAPGPVWTPLQPISRSKENMEGFGKKKPLIGRIGQPSEIAPSYVFLASNDSSQYTGQVLHPNSGCIVGS
jgi:NAD(P)-dependent dehydrogenase (short-subunit alcohol dehydrogenase family)